MLGAFISDDYYFFFEEKDIGELARGKKIVGTFAINNLQIKLSVSVYTKSKKKYKRTDIQILTSFKETHFSMTEDDFNEWLLHPTDWVREHGPAWRCASINVYITRETSSNAKIRKREIENFIAQAK